MAWQAYHVTYRAQTPVALGAYRFGFIQRTRYYAPGWTLWGAITAQLTRALLPRATGDDYEEVGGFVAANLPTSYAYVLVEGQPAWPHYEEGQLRYGPLIAAEFEARFVASYGQTAVALNASIIFLAATCVDYLGGRMVPEALGFVTLFLDHGRRPARAWPTPWPTPRVPSPRPSC